MSALGPCSQSGMSTTLRPGRRAMAWCQVPRAIPHVPFGATIDAHAIGMARS